MSVECERRVRAWRELGCVYGSHISETGFGAVSHFQELVLGEQDGFEPISVDFDLGFGHGRELVSFESVGG